MSTSSWSNLLWRTCSSISWNSRTFVWTCYEGTSRDCIVSEDKNFDASEFENSADFCDPGTECDVVIQGERLATRASLGRFSVTYGDILREAPDHGLDAREAVDELEDDQTTPLARAADITLIGPVTAHGLF